MEQRSEVVKIGREINRYKKLDGCNKHQIEKRFGKDAGKLFERKTDSGLTRQIAREVVGKLKKR